MVDPSHARKYSKAEIEEIVAGLLGQAYPEGVSVPIDIDLLVEQHSGVDDIIPAELLEDKFGVSAALIYKPATETFDIFVDEDTYTRQRGRASFSIAHEFGHVVLHADVCRKCCTLEATLELRRRLRKSYSRMEQDVDSFASAILMPRWLLQHHAVHLYKGLIGLYGYDRRLVPYKLASGLASQYKVSVKAMEVRLERLGLCEEVLRCIDRRFPFLEV